MMEVRQRHIGGISSLPLIRNATLAGVLLVLAGVCIPPARAETQEGGAAQRDTAQSDAVTSVVGEAVNDVTARAPRKRAGQPRAGSTLDGRVRTLAQALDLDARQQAALRGLLEAQREEILKVWSDLSLPAPNRIAASEAISDRTADRIRAMLTEEQKKKYNPPPPADAAGHVDRPDVEAWMNPTQQKQ